ncbi:MAG: tyrosine-type recombinase/integrase [Bacteroidota bacterium]|nr:tyrosine-type recombinase/integrase [Bacteroidota bacterium]
MELIDYLNSRYTPSTSITYKKYIENFTSNISNAEKAQYKDILNYIGLLRKGNKKSKTINIILSSIKVFYDYLYYIGQRKDNPAKYIFLKDNKHHIVQPQDLFTKDELESLLEIKNSVNKNMECRNKVLVSLLIYQGVSSGEIENITINDIDLSRGTIFIKSSKLINSRELQLKQTQIMLFHHYINIIRPKLLKSNKSDVFILTENGIPIHTYNITVYIKRTFGNCFNGKLINPIKIRQSVIANLLKSGHDLRIVQTFAGHKCVSTTEQYKQTQVESLRTEINRYHPIK